LTDTGPSSFPVNDKVVHFGLYFVLGSTLAWGRARSGWVLGHTMLIALGVLYGVTDEWHQSFVPGRDASIADWIADCIGVVAGYAATTGLLSGRVGRGGTTNQPVNQDERNDD